MEMVTKSVEKATIRGEGLAGIAKGFVTGIVVSVAVKYISKGAAKGIEVLKVKLDEKKSAKADPKPATGEPSSAA